MAGTAVYLELGKKKVFACALDWPGWARPGKEEQRALAALADYATRYAEVAATAGLDLPSPAAFDVVHRLPGDAGTEFGVPGVRCPSDGEPLTAMEAGRLADLVEASWTVLDRIAAVTPEGLRKGPRGGGRDRTRMLEHVVGAEASYARKLGVRHKVPALDDHRAVAALRTELAAAIRGSHDGVNAGPKGWPPRYAARRIAWHVLDHAWEMQDRTEPS